MQPNNSLPVPVDGLDETPVDRDYIAPWIPIAVPLFAVCLLTSAYIIFALAI
jgi:hypothetical protein